MLTPPSLRHQLSPRTPKSVPEKLDRATPIKFPQKKRNVKAHLKIKVIKLSNCPKDLEEARLSFSWRWGSQQENRGVSEMFSVTSGMAMIVYEFQVVTEFQQELPNTKSNKMFIMMHRHNGSERETIAQRYVDMAEFCVDRLDKTKSFVVDKASKMALMVNVLAHWLEVDGKKVERREEQNVSVPSLPIASPTSVPSLQPRPNVLRTHIKSPVVIHEAMKGGQRKVVLDGAKTPNPMLEKMMEAKGNHVKVSPNVHLKAEVIFLLVYLVLNHLSLLFARARRTREVHLII